MVSGGVNGADNGTQNSIFTNFIIIISYIKLNE